MLPPSSTHGHTVCGLGATGFLADAAGCTLTTGCHSSLVVGAYWSSANAHTVTLNGLVADTEGGIELRHDFGKTDDVAAADHRPRIVDEYVWKE